MSEGLKVNSILTILDMSGEKKKTKKRKRKITERITGSGIGDEGKKAARDAWGTYRERLDM